MKLTALTIFRLALGLSVSLTSGAWAGEQNAHDSAAGLPAAYAKNYLVARSTMSPDRKFAVIYPTLDFSDSKDAKDLLVALNPFSVVATLATEDPYFQNKSNSGLTAKWSKDGSVAMITIDIKWGPGDVFVVELSGGKVKRISNILDKLQKSLEPKFRAAEPKPEPYNDFAPFLFEEGDNPGCTLEGNSRVRIDLKATNDPKGLSDRPWKMRVKAEWDIAQAKFISQTVTKEK